MVRYTITPWRTQADLLQVRAQLYGLDGASGRTDARRTAIDRVMAWKLRGHLPHAVESTAVLVDAIMHHQPSTAESRLRREFLSNDDDGDDQDMDRESSILDLDHRKEDTGNVSSNSDFSVRAVYVAAFCRFVTGFCDIGRQRERGLEPVSMLEVARQIDMPAYFVALRHEATHDELPGVPRLVAATNDALAWLWRVYWSRLEEDVDPVEARRARIGTAERVKTPAVKMLRDFRKARRDVLRGRRMHSGLGGVSALSDACVELCDGAETGGEALAAVLVEDRLIFPSTRELGSSMDGAFLIWDEFVDSLDVRILGFRAALVQSCLDSIVDQNVDLPDDAQKEALTRWILHLLERDDSLAVRVVKFCCLYPGLWTQRLGEELLHLREAQLSDWKDLFLASHSSDDMQSAGVVVEETKASSGVQANAEVPGKAITAGGWRRAVLPSAVPIGVTA